MKRIGHWIGGSDTEGLSGATVPVFNPALGTQIAAVDLADDREVDRAVQCARNAGTAWGATSISQRTAVMFRFRNLLDCHREDLAQIVTQEHGKVLSDARGEVARGIENVEFSCGLAEALKGSFSTEASTGIDVQSLLQPLGVVAGITPFNFPVMVPLWMISNGLACGNAFVLKPSEKDPSASLLIARLLQEAGLPDGAFSVVNGDKRTVDSILNHPDIAAVSFVGSTPVARHVYDVGTKAGKRVQALGGAKNHMVVLPDADINAAADAAVSAAFGSAGERCMAVSVVVAVGGIGDALLDAIASRIPRLRIGAGTNPDSEMGPLISADHRDRVAAYVGTADASGATLVVDGRGAQVGDEGFFLGCSLIDHVSPGMSVYDDEIFGPVLGVVRKATLDDAIELVNANPYGNGVCIFTRDGSSARRFSRQVTVGMVGINVAVPVPVGFYSFGGWKSSMFGDTAMYGPEGVRFYTRQKVVTTRWPDVAASTIDLGFPQTR